jgi:hypothetical protein
MKPHFKKWAKTVGSISARMHPSLAGQSPEVQGAVLAELVSLWIAGHHPDLREDLLDGWIALVRALVPISEKGMFGPSRFPVGGMS